MIDPSQHRVETHRSCIKRSVDGCPNRPESAVTWGPVPDWSARAFSRPLSECQESWEARTIELCHHGRLMASVRLHGTIVRIPVVTFSTEDHPGQTVPFVGPRESRIPFWPALVAVGLDSSG